jgi:hypothetical protein
VADWKEEERGGRGRSRSRRGRIRVDIRRCIIFLSSQE